MRLASRPAARAPSFTKPMHHSIKAGSANCRMIPSATRPAMCRTLGPYPATHTRGESFAQVSRVGCPSCCTSLPEVRSRNSATAASNCDQLTGFFPMTRRELSPRPMPSSIRPPEIRLSVANKLAVTVKSRVAGFVTHVPSRMRCVLVAISVSRGYGSFHKTWESKIQPYSNPAASAWRVKPTMRSIEISGFSAMPNCMAESPSSIKKSRTTKVRQCSIEFFSHPVRGAATNLRRVPWVLTRSSRTVL